MQQKKDFLSLCILFCSLAADVFPDWIDLETALASDVQAQSFIDYYASGNKSVPLSRQSLLTNFALFNTSSSEASFNFRSDWYQKINTTVLTSGFSYKLQTDNSISKAFYLGYDYTAFDDNYFNQIVLGYGANTSFYDIIVHFYTPVGESESKVSEAQEGTDTGAGTDDDPRIVTDTTTTSSVVPLFGADVSVSKRYDRITLLSMVSYYFHQDVKKAVMGSSLGFEYQPNDVMRLGARYQARDEYAGPVLYSTISLFNPPDSHARNRFDAMALRHYGAVFARKVATQTETRTTTEDDGGNSSTVTTYQTVTCHKADGIVFCTTTD